MIAASIFDHPGYLILVAFIMLVRWLISKAKSQTQETRLEESETQDAAPIAPPPSRPILRGGETQTEEERIRKFLEALGQPPGTRPPKVTPRPRPVIVPQIFPRLPTLKTVPPPLPVEMPAPIITPPPMPVPMTTARPLDSDYQVQDFQRQISSEPPSERRNSVASRVKLGTPQDLRTAIVLREIFGPPRSLQPIDLTSAL